MDLNDRIAHCRLLVSLIVADDEITAEETAFLRRSFERLGVAEEEMAEVMDSFSEQDALTLVRGLERVARLDSLNDLACAAYADKRLDEEEEAFLKRVSEGMDLDAADLDEALARARALNTRA